MKMRTIVAVAAILGAALAASPSDGTSAGADCATVTVRFAGPQEIRTRAMEQAVRWRMISRIWDHFMLNRHGRIGWKN